VGGSVVRLQPDRLLERSNRVLVAAKLVVRQAELPAGVGSVGFRRTASLQAVTFCWRWSRAECAMPYVLAGMTTAGPASTGEDADSTEDHERTR